MYQLWKMRRIQDDRRTLHRYSSQRRKLQVTNLPHTHRPEQQTTGAQAPFSRFPFSRLFLTPFLSSLSVCGWLQEQYHHLDKLYRQLTPPPPPRSPPPPHSRLPLPSSPPAPPSPHALSAYCHAALSVGGESVGEGEGGALVCPPSPSSLCGAAAARIAKTHIPTYLQVRVRESQIERERRLGEGGLVVKCLLIAHTKALTLCLFSIVCLCCYGCRGVCRVGCVCPW